MKEIEKSKLILLIDKNVFSVYDELNCVLSHSYDEVPKNPRIVPYVDIGSLYKKSSEARSLVGILIK